MNTTEEGDEPVGEAPEVTLARVGPITMARAARLVDRQTQALAEIRSYLATVDAIPFTESRSENDVICGDRRTVAGIAAILERHGLG